MFMQCFDFYTQMKVGLPRNQTISNNLNDLKMYHFLDVSDVKFQDKIKATKVNQEKDWEKWDWNMLLEICEGNLITTARLPVLI